MNNVTIKSRINILGRIALVIGLAVVIGFVGLAAHNIKSLNSDLKQKELKLNDKNIQIEKLNSKWEKVNKDLDDAKSSSSSSKQKIEELEKEKQDLENKLQAKAEEKARLAKAAEAKQASATPVAQTTGNCQTWMNQAGITDQANAYKLIMIESGCNPNARNKSSSACGIGQQLPCGKWKHQWNDPVGSMIDMQEYVMARYGSWAKALSFHYAKGWY